MRVFQPRPKDRRAVPIPADLREAMREVFELTKRSKNDPDINLDYGDAIQVGAICGGRYGQKPRPYVLTYFPKGDHERGRWYFALHETEIEDIADGQLTEMTLYCCTSADCRCKFREPDEKCIYCDYVDDPNYGTFAFPEAAAKLVERGVSGLSEHSSREDVIAGLGPPDGTGGGVKHPKLGYVEPWIIYRRADCQLRFAFNKTGKRIKSITIMEKDWKPGK